MKQLSSQIDSIDLGKSVKKLETSPDWGAFSKVILRIDDDGKTVTAGNDSGLTLEAECHWATAQTAQDILNSLSNYRYSPYKAEGAILSPAAELGDRVNIDGSGGGLYSMSKIFGAVCATTISAPSQTEDDREIVHVNHTDRRFTRKMADINSSFSAQATQINTALKDAKDASDSAAEANDLATAANTNANQAKDTAATALSRANTAKDTAESAAATAMAANNLATTANTNANQAKDAAATAKSTADTAKETTDKVEAAFTFTGDSVTAKKYVYTDRVYASNYFISSTDGDTNIQRHTHFVTVDSSGNLTLGAADWSGSEHPFNIADTQFYKAGVAARTASSLSYATFSEDGSTDYGHVIASSSDGNTEYLAISPNAYDEGYQVGYAAGGGGVVVDTISATRTTGSESYNSTTKYVSSLFTLRAIDSNGTVVKTRSDVPLSIPASLAFNAGYDAGAATAVVDTLSTGAAGTPMKSLDGTTWHAMVNVTGTAKGTNSDGTSTGTTDTKSQQISTDVTTVYNKGYTDGAASASHTPVATLDFGTVSYSSSTNKYTVPATATAECGGSSDTDSDSISFTATAAYNAGQDYGAGTVDVTTINAGIAGTPTSPDGGSHWYSSVSVTAYAEATKSDGTKASDSFVQSKSVDVTAAYNAGKAAGGGGHSITFGSVSYSDGKFHVTATCGGVSATIDMTPQIAWDGVTADQYDSSTYNMIFYRQFKLDNATSENKEMDIYAKAAYDHGYGNGEAAHANDYNRGYNAGHYGVIIPYDGMLGWHSSYVKIQLSNGNKYYVYSNGRVVAVVDT